MQPQDGHAPTAAEHSVGATTEVPTDTELASVATTAVATATMSDGSHADGCRKMALVLLQHACPASSRKPHDGHAPTAAEHAVCATTAVPM